MDINVVTLSYYEVGEQELIARTWVVDPAQLEERISSEPTDVERAWTGLWHFNTGAHEGRSWDDARRFGFLSAGGGAKWREEVAKLPVGAHLYAYINGAGYCGGGVVTSTSVRADRFKPQGGAATLGELTLNSDFWLKHADDDEIAEYVIDVNWIKTVPESDGLRVPHPLRGTVRKILARSLPHRSELHSGNGVNWSRPSVTKLSKEGAECKRSAKASAWRPWVRRGPRRSGGMNEGAQYTTAVGVGDSSR